MKLLIKFPTRQRATKFFQVLRQYQEAITEPSTRFLITIDHDDQSMNNDESKKVLNMWGNLTYKVDWSDNKIHAVNRDLQGEDFDVLLLASDDMIPQERGIDKIVIDAMQEHFPDTDGCLWFFDGHLVESSRVCTLLIVGRRYYERFGYLYNPVYKSFFCDNEFTEVAIKLNKIKFIDRCIIRHEHPMINKRLRSDGLYEHNNRFWNHDKGMYNERSKTNFV